MYYELGTMVRIRKDASPFVNHEKGIGYPRFDIIGEIVCIHPTILSYAVRLSKKFTLTFYQDDIYELPKYISSRRDIFHKLISFDKVNQPFYYPKEFESFVNEDKYCEHDVKATKEAWNAMFNKTPKYSVNDIVIIDKGFSDEYNYSAVVGVINDVYNHRDTGEVFYHIIFNSGTPRKVFEYEIKAKFNTDRFKDGQSIHKQLLVQMYHTRSYKYLTEKEVLEWADANYFEEIKDEKTTGEELLKLSKECIKYDRERPEILPEYRNIPIGLEQSLNKVHDEMINSLLYSVPTFYMSKDEFKLPTKEEINAMFGVSKFEYKKIIFSGPCTIILWMDGTKTMARTNKEETFDPEKGVAICFMKKMLGHTETNKVLRKASKDFYDEIAREANRQLDEELRKATFPLPKGVTFRPFDFDVSMNNKVIKVKEEEQDD